MCKNRKYFYPQVVLTCQDKILDEIFEDEEGDEQHQELKMSQSMNQRVLDFEKEQKLREVIDMKIEKVVLNLGISRSCVHFIENYKFENEP